MTKKAAVQTTLLEATSLQERLDRNPYGVVAGAFGLGFVLGGGLFTRFTGRIVGAAVRVGLTAALPYLQEELMATVTRGTDDDGQESDQSKSPARRKKTGS
ncbi:MAG: hypothetical protein ABUS79_00930 [Pseudomonadota bacterium]